MKLFLVFFTLLLNFGVSFKVMADTYRQIVIKHRDPGQLHNRLLPLISEKTSIAVDGKAILIGGSANEVNGLISLIKKLDRPRQKLLISIYRGENPAGKNEPFQNKYWSSRSVVNSIDEITIEEDSAFTITETAIYKSTVEDYRFSSELDKTSRLNKKHSEAIYRKSDFFETSYKTQVRASLLENKKVAIDALFSQALENSDGLKNDHPVKVIEKKINSTIALSTWSKLSSQTLQTNRTSLSKQVKVYSTKGKKDSTFEIWIKVERIKP
jgi:hypothetical protein